MYTQSANDYVSVVMPAYNAGATITNSIESVLAQSYQGLEVIVVNDGSTDNTKECVRALMVSDSRIKYIEITNQGVSAARNIALKDAKHKWIAFCDSDDVWFPQKLERQFSHINSHEWSYTDSYYIGKDYQVPVLRSAQSKLYEGNIKDQLILENFLTTSSILVRKKIIAEHGCFDESMLALEDWDLWLKVAKKYPISFCEEPLLNYLVADGSTSRKVEEIFQIHVDLVRRHAADYSEQQVNQSLAKSAEICSIIAENVHEYKNAIRYQYRALQHDNNIKRIVRIAKLIVKSTYLHNESRSL